MHECCSACTLRITYANTQHASRMWHMYNQYHRCSWLHNSITQVSPHLRKMWYSTVHKLHMVLKISADVCWWIEHLAELAIKDQASDTTLCQTAARVRSEVASWDVSGPEYQIGNDSLWSITDLLKMFLEYEGWDAPKLWPAPISCWRSWTCSRCFNELACNVLIIVAERAATPSQLAIGPPHKAVKYYVWRKDFSHCFCTRYAYA